MTTSIPIPWRLKEQRYQLIGKICPECYQTSFPPREVCPHCSQQPDAFFLIDQIEGFTEEALAVIEVHG